MKKIVSSIISFVSLFYGLLGAVAARAEACPAGQFCNPLAYDNFEDLLSKVTTFIFQISIPIAAVMFVISGVMFVISAGDPKKITTAKNVALYTAIGIAVIMIASGLVKVLQSLLQG